MGVSVRESRKHGLRKLVDVGKFRQLETAKWGQIAKRLLVISHSCAGKYPQLGYGLHEQLALGITHQDIVETVIQKTISGERNWDPSRGNLELWLAYQIKGEIWNLANKSATIAETILPEHEAEEGALDSMEYDSFLFPEPIFSTSPSPESGLLTKERVEMEVELLFMASSGDPELVQLLEAIFNNYLAKPSELADPLNVPVEDVYRRIRKLRRRVNRLRMEEL